MGLSTYNGTIDNTTPLTDFTIDEITVTGYARQSLTGWGTPTLSGGTATSNASNVTFSNTSGSATPTIYSWFWYDTTNSVIVAAGAFANPFTIPATSGTYVVTPYDSLVSG